MRAKTTKWCRLHVDALHDPKIVLLTDSQFRMWIQLLLVAAPRNGMLPETEIVTCETRRTVSEALHHIDELVSRGLIDKLSDGTLKMHGWEKRQYLSDTSTDRVKRFRERQRNVSSSFQKRPQSTDSDTDNKPPEPPLRGARRRTRKRDQIDQFNKALDDATRKS